MWVVCYENPPEDLPDCIMAHVDPECKITDHAFEVSSVSITTRLIRAGTGPTIV